MIDRPPLAIVLADVPPPLENAFTIWIPIILVVAAVCVLVALVVRARRARALAARAEERQSDA